jgi:phenylacetate-CoA ligase
MNAAPTFQQKIYEMLMASQYWPPEQMRAYQRSQLSQLLRHARATVPFYKTRLDVVFKRNGEIDWHRWNEIPIVTRADLRDRRNEMLTTALPDGHGPTKTYHSSGSSGVPISVEATGLASMAKNAALQRQLSLAAVGTRKSRAQITNLNERGENFGEDFYFKHPNQIGLEANEPLVDIVINRKLSDHSTLQILKKYNIRYLFDNPNSAELLARANLKYKHGVKLEAIFCTGQELTRDQKLLLRESFGCRGHIVYSSKEGGMMGFECGDGPNFHINAELVLLEIVSPNDILCETGQPGRVIITPFFSTALPLIRYDQGDTARFVSSKKCSCKTTLPILGDIIGRQDQVFQLPNGPKSITGVGAGFLTEKLNALAFQLAQTAPLEMEVRYVPIEFGVKIVTEPIIAHLRDLIHPEMTILLKPVEKIAMNSGGKLQRYVCEINQ